MLTILWSICPAIGNECKTRSVATPAEPIAPIPDHRRFLSCYNNPLEGSVCEASLDHSALVLPWVTPRDIMWTSLTSFSESNVKFSPSIRHYPEILRCIHGQHVNAAGSPHASLTSLTRLVPAAASSLLS
ncbi:hypothetical protein ACMYSQ_012124 [Aspergillus niger]